MDEKIIQIIPADGWFAVYNMGDSEDRIPLVCFALVEFGDGSREVRGYETDPSMPMIGDASRMSNLARFEHVTAKPTDPNQPD